MNTIEQRLRDLLVEQLEMTPEKITPDWVIIDGTVVDSLDYVEVIMAIEEEFNLTVWDDDAEAAKTFAQLLDMVIKYVSGELPK